MSRRSRPWLYGITPGGLIVTLTSALVTLGFTSAAVALFLQGDVTTGTAVGAIASSSLATTVALQARNRPDPAATIEEPATMTATSGPGDAGAGEVRLVLLFCAGVLLALVVYHYLAPHLST